MGHKTALLAATALAALAQPLAAETAADELVIALSADIRSLNGTNRDNNTDVVLNHIYDSLVGFREDLSVGPALAESWDVSEDGTVYTFHLREGALFHDGTPITSEDVKAAIEWRLAPEQESACIPNFDGTRGLVLQSIETPDPATLVMTINAPNALFLTRLAEVQCDLWVFSPANLDESGAWISGSAIGSGPLVLDAWNVGESIELARFADYVPSAAPTSGYSGDRTVNFDTVTFQIIPDATVRETALLAGDVDIVNNISANRVADLEAQGAVVQTAPGLGWTTILVQTEDPLLSDPKMREALAHAIDFAQIADVKNNGLAPFNPSAVAESSAFFDESFQTWPEYDPELARTMAAEAGYAGEPIVMQTNSRYQGMYENSILVQAMLSAAGFNVELETLEWGTQLDNFLSGNFQLQSFGWSARLDPSLAYGMFMGSKAEDGSNQWDNPAAQEIYLQTLVETDTEARGELFRQLHAMMVEDLPIFGLYYAPNIGATRANVDGFLVWSADNQVAWGVTKTP
ncbi:ABC transporter substrate-binding protein [Pseudoroseicyclus sp. CXY001]|uniref:ABC transporter substrate-binding protein n=1 Tax=Pseudoroseicyclus sp. CXY001 TaxID=3242492 RepID=UPI00358DD820